MNAFPSLEMQIRTMNKNVTKSYLYSITMEKGYIVLGITLPPNTVIHPAFLGRLSYRQ